MHVSQQPYEVKTILGSCVAVCLWDTVLKQGGINHYLMPLWNGNSLPTPKYGNIAITKLIEKLIAQGSQRRSLIAKVFGGSNQFSNSNMALNIGHQNILIARQILKEENIPIMGEDTGGRHGRIILFYTATGEVLMKTLDQTTN